MSEFQQSPEQRKERAIEATKVVLTDAKNVFEASLEELAKANPDLESMRHLSTLFTEFGDVGAVGERMRKLMIELNEIDHGIDLRGPNEKRY